MPFWGLVELRRLRESLCGKNLFLVSYVFLWWLILFHSLGSAIVVFESHAYDLITTNLLPSLRCLAS